MHQTLIDLPEATRVEMVDTLQQTLADTIDVMMQIKQAHWTVKGPSFIALHKLFDEIFEEVSEHVDEQAERIAQLGGQTEGTIRAAADRSSIDEYPLEIAAGREHVQQVSRALASLGQSFKNGIGESARLGDAVTADIYTVALRNIDKNLWFVESHMQELEAPDNAVSNRRLDEEVVERSSTH